MTTAHSRKVPRSKKGNAISVFLVDDHEVVREGLSVILRDEPKIEVAGEASSGEEAVEAIKKLKPDVVLMDIRMPDKDGFEAAQDIKKINPDIAVIMLTGYESELYATEAMRVKAAGFITKDSPKKYLINAIEMASKGFNVWQGDWFYNSENQTKAAGSAASPANTNEKPLTPRELEVLRLLGKGYGNKQIVSALNVSDSTVKKHVYTILHKFKLKNRTEAALRAVEMGLN